MGWEWNWPRKQPREHKEQDMTTTDRIMESLMVLESKSDSRFLAIHGEDEPQVRAVIEKVLAEQGALTVIRRWSVSHRQIEKEGCCLGESVDPKGKYVLFADHHATLESARRGKVSMAAVEKAVRSLVNPDDRTISGIDCFQNMPVDYFIKELRARLTAPPVKPAKQEIVVAVLGQYDFQTQDLGIEELANEIVVRLDAADKEKCDG
jgi:hypothetical protein